MSNRTLIQVTISHVPSLYVLVNVGCVTLYSTGVDVSVSHITSVNVLVNVGLCTSVNVVVIVGHCTAVNIVVGVNVGASRCTGVLVNVGHGTCIDVVVIVRHGTVVGIQVDVGQCTALNVVIGIRAGTGRCRVIVIGINVGTGTVNRCVIDVGYRAAVNIVNRAGAVGCGIAIHKACGTIDTVVSRLCEGKSCVQQESYTKREFLYHFYYYLCLVLCI